MLMMIVVLPAMFQKAFAGAVASRMLKLEDSTDVWLLFGSCAKFQDVPDHDARCALICLLLTPQ